LALNTASLNHEEFPVFREFWLKKPARGDDSITVWALLDGPSVAGAFEFVMTPGVATVAHVRTLLFPRVEVKEFGLAPLTSMFLHDENSHPAYADFRPEVHDSDGLLCETGLGEWLWRPLDTGKAARFNSYLDSDPKGFGLMQRDREFEHYQDTVARFDLRPSVWVEPVGHWGSGRVELIQLPSDTEYMDNVVAFWVPQSAPKRGESLSLEYKLHWQTNEVCSPALALVRATRFGRIQGGPPARPPRLRFVVDFVGTQMAGWPAEEPVAPQVHCGDGAEVVHSTVEKNAVNNTWRLVIETTVPTRAVDLQAKLTRGQKAVTETWNYTWQP
jgi:glucans biosynthesis protein